jgi:hypothetical protein
MVMKIYLVRVPDEEEKFDLFINYKDASDMHESYGRDALPIEEHMLIE